MGSVLIDVDHPHVDVIEQSVVRTTTSNRMSFWACGKREITSRKPESGQAKLFTQFTNEGLNESLTNFNGTTECIGSMIQTQICPKTKPRNEKHLDCTDNRSRRRERKGGRRSIWGAVPLTPIGKRDEGGRIPTSRVRRETGDGVK
jgi:hypothetical protein